MSHVTLRREDPWRLVPGFLQTLPHLPFPFGYALPPFTVVSHNRDNDYILGPVSSLRESPNLGMVGGHLKEILDLCQNLYFSDVIHKIF